MKLVLIIVTYIFITTNGLRQQSAFAQTSPHSFSGSLDPKEILAVVKKAQASLRTVSYTLHRTDTLVTGDIRSMSGKVMMMSDTQDSIFGFRFHAKKDGENSERVYDGHVGYEVNHESKSYLLTVEARQMPNLLNSGGGHLIFEDLVAIDTSNATAFQVSQDGDFFYLTMRYPDISQYNVRNRYKTLTINKAMMLPVARRIHQETLGKVQDLYYKIIDMYVNEPDFQYDFSSLSFLKEYNQKIVRRSVSPVMASKDQHMPPFKLRSFNNEIVSSAASEGKVILIDFWEIWCGPCVESLPKIQKLYDAYKSKGLQVFGIVNNLKQLDAAKVLVNKLGLTYPMLIGNEQLKKDYRLNGTVPLYMLVNKKGSISMISEGYPADVEVLIQEALIED